MKKFYHAEPARITHLVLPIPRIQQIFQLLAHSHGELLNSSKLGLALGVSHTMFRRYVEFLEHAYLIRILRPFEINLKKRIVKNPKIYFRDSGILHSILTIDSFDNLLGYPSYGNSWEGFVIEQIISAIGDRWSAFFYRTQVGAELDLVLQKGELRIGIECKASTAPTVSRGFWNCLEDLQILPENSWIICPIDEKYPYKNGTYVGGVRQIIKHIRNASKN
jgi:predicted AAA+ superfamily ATPase